MHARSVASSCSTECASLRVFVRRMFTGASTEVRAHFLALLACMERACVCERDALFSSLSWYVAMWSRLSFVSPVCRSEQVQLCCATCLLSLSLFDQVLTWCGQRKKEREREGGGGGGKRDRESVLKGSRHTGMMCTHMYPQR